MKPAPPCEKGCKMNVFIEIILVVVVWLLLNLVVAFILALIAYNLQEQE